MTIERRKDGSIVISSNNGVTAISRIGGAEASNAKRQESFQSWVDECAKLVTAGVHTLKETEQYFLERCDAVPLALNDVRMKNFKHSVIQNFFKDMLEHQPPDFSFDMTDEEIEKWRKERDAMLEESLNSPPERFGLILRGYLLPRTERNAVYYEEARQNWEEQAAKNPKYSPEQAAQIVHPDIYFCFEKTTEFIYSSGGGESLIGEMMIFKGISEEDIKERTPRFLGYISSLRDIGKLPDFRKE